MLPNRDWQPAHFSSRVPGIGCGGGADKDLSYNCQGDSVDECDRTLSGLTATTSLPCGDTATAAAIGRLRSMAEEGRTAEAAASVRLSRGLLVRGQAHNQATSRSRAGSASAIRAVFEGLLRLIFHLAKQQ